MKLLEGAGNPTLPAGTSVPISVSSGLAIITGVRPIHLHAQHQCHEDLQVLSIPQDSPYCSL
jgi:hypothetical protein